ncbi:hypothetical protein IEO21_03134 [Rhodonia placenta]|uniref:Essential protein Yae1 N-terminal domain-containing protein n=1 Tax=Rhodonia placenta TaxID=104341 RepID=A0A8H7U4I7_9APHY|nr:hypothetical protein IEO21_03134 [Postia placenta]
MDFDLESLVDVEQRFYDDGYHDGFAHGKIHGSIEGRALGREKGFEMWEELGFYEGFALMWQAIHAQQSRNEDRTAHHIRQLLDLIGQFPRVNPSATEPSDLDIPRLFRQIRSRYKALCATLGVRPTLRAADCIAPNSSEDAENGNSQSSTRPSGSKSVWPVQSIDNQRSGEQFSF